MYNTTAGRLLINEILPPELRSETQVLDKSGLKTLLQQVAERHPDKYRDVSHRLAQLGAKFAYITGGHSFGLQHLTRAKASQQIRQEVEQKLEELLNNKQLTEQQREDAIIDTVGSLQDRQTEEVYKESLAENNPLALQLKGAGRGNKLALARLRGSDLLYTDHRNRVVPIPIMRSYSEGLSPAEYWAASYGSRRGVIATKLCLWSETPVLMADYSVKPIRQVRVGDLVMGADSYGHLAPTKVQAVIRNGKRECHRFTFRIGSTREEWIDLVATEDHKVLAQIRAGEQSHRAIYASLPLPLRMARYRLDPTKNDFVAIPPKGEYSNGVAESRALLAGLMLGDGCMAPSAHGNYQFSCADQELLDDVREYMAQFNLEFRNSRQKGYSYTLAEIVPSKRVKDNTRKYKPFAAGQLNETKRWLRRVLGDKKAHEKCLPAEVFTWNDAAVGDLVSGLYATDGSITLRRNGCTISFASTSRQLITGLKRLLELRLGIWAGKLSEQTAERRAHAVNTLYSFHISHPECVRRFAQRVPLVGVKKHKLRLGVAKLSKVPRSQQLGFKLLHRASMGKLPTYDLSVDNADHLFVLANGLIVSNSTADAGYLGKTLNQIMHRGVVSAVDADKPSDTPRGLPVDTDDPDNEGSLLAVPAGGFARNTVLTPAILAELRRKGHQRIVVRSVIANGAPDGGVYARDAGYREYNRLPLPGESIGNTAGQALSEPISQGSLGAKHSAGVRGAAAGRLASGFKAIEQLINVPKTFMGAASHATLDGRVQRVSPAPAGGQYVHIEGTSHYVPPGAELKVKPGDTVEAGDVLSDGTPNPAIITEHKGVGEGRRYFVHAFTDTLNQAGIRPHRRNVELLARGLINHVRLTDEYADGAPDDVMPYSFLEHRYEPRVDSEDRPLQSALGRYLEKPYLHYSIGTKVRPSVIKTLGEFGVHSIRTHHEPPPFEAEMVRGVDNAAHDPDWQTRMYGSRLETNLLRGAHRGAVSDPFGTSFVPGLASGQHFGRQGKLKLPKGA